MKVSILILFSLLAIANAGAKSYNIRLIVENDEFEFVCDDDQTIYEAAKMFGVEFNYEYDGGATDLSLARLNYGVIDLSKQSYLNARQIEEKLILLTVAYPKSDCEIDLSVLQDNSHRLKDDYRTYGALFNGARRKVHVQTYIYTIRAKYLSLVQPGFCALFVRDDDLIIADYILFDYLMEITNFYTRPSFFFYLYVSYEYHFADGWLEYHFWG